MQSDAALIDASRLGDRSAFAQIIERYHRAVYAVAFSSTRDRALADDITQDTFVTAWRRFDDLRDTSRLPAWLCGIARNLGRDARKRLRRETLGDPTELVDATTPYEALSEAESDRLVEAALGQVPDVYREPLVLYYYEERSVEDVARSLGISPATTNKRLSRGRQYLAERVAIIERGVTRRGPNPYLAASVLAVIGIVAPGSHVDASPVPVKGSNMSKLAIAAAVTAALGGAALLIATAARGGDAHAQSRAPAHADSHADSSKPCLTAALAAAHEHLGGTKSAPRAPEPPTLFAMAASGGASTDCAAVGRHLAELEADTTHGPAHRPDEATCDQCAANYTTQCETQGWPLERRTCALAAGDLINAHLCASAKKVSAAVEPTNIPAPLRCAALGQHIATTVQTAGLYADVTDMPQQVEAACEMGAWTIELRQCFAAATTIATLQACVVPSP